MCILGPQLHTGTPPVSLSTICKRKLEHICKYSKTSRYTEKLASFLEEVVRYKKTTGSFKVICSSLDQSVIECSKNFSNFLVSTNFS